jgi:hypothetical protein
MLPKLLVSVLFILEVVQTVLATEEGFRMFGYGYGDLTSNPLPVNKVGLMWLAVPVLESLSMSFPPSFFWAVQVIENLVAVISQSFYAWRIWILSKSLVLPVIICAVSCLAWPSMFLDPHYHFLSSPLYSLVQDYGQASTRIK